MHILIVTQYFWPETFRINDLALGLVERGHRVTVLTGSPNYPDGKFYKGYGIVNREEDYYGVRVLRVPLVPRGGGGAVRLALNYVSFAVIASILGPFLCRGVVDHILVYEPSPFTVGIPAVLLRSLKAAPLSFWVQDLWPESLSATGAVKSETVLSLVSRLVRFIYRRCDKVLIQAESFREPVAAQGAAADRIFYFPNSAEEHFAQPAPYDGLLPQLPEGFRLMFAGNIGSAQDFETIINAAELLKECRKIRWIVIGDGRMRSWCENEVARRGLQEHLHFLGRFPLEAMPAFFAAADALLVTLKKEPIFALTIPSKIQSYLACGRPVVAALDGEGARIIDEAGAGYSCPAGDPDALAAAVLKMYRTSESERAAMGVRGRSYYREHFDRTMLIDRLEGWMREMADGRGSQ